MAPRRFIFSVNLNAHTLTNFVVPRVTRKSSARLKYVYTGRTAGYETGQVAKRDNPIYKAEFHLMNPLSDHNQTVENSLSHVYGVSNDFLSKSSFKITHFIMVAELLAKVYQFSLFFNVAVRIVSFLIYGSKTPPKAHFLVCISTTIHNK
jgi:hypothetical protein